MKSCTLLVCVGILALSLGVTALPRADIDDDDITNEQDTAALNELLSTLQSADESTDDEPDTFLQSVDESTDDEPDELMKIVEQAQQTDESQEAQEQVVSRFMSVVRRMIRTVAGVRNTSLRRKLAGKYISTINRILARNPALRRQLQGYEEAQEQFLSLAALKGIHAGWKLGRMVHNYAKKRRWWAEVQDDTDSDDDVDSPDETAQEQLLGHLISGAISHLGAEAQDDTDSDDDDSPDDAQEQFLGKLRSALKRKLRGKVRNLIRRKLLPYRYVYYQDVDDDGDAKKLARVQRG